MAQIVKDALREADRDPNRKQEAEPSSQKPTADEMPLKGTFASVMILGAFLLATWITVFVLYIHRK